MFWLLKNLPWTNLSKNKLIICFRFPQNIFSYGSISTVIIILWSLNSLISTIMGSVYRYNPPPPPQVIFEYKIKTPSYKTPSQWHVDKIVLRFFLILFCKIKPLVHVHLQYIIYWYGHWSVLFVKLTLLYRRIFRHT